MRTLLETIAVACSMFSALPVPQVQWNEKNMRFSLAAFPLIGVIIGGFEILWILLCMRCDLPSILSASGVTVLPILITGGIHLDGYMDVSDALSSYGDAQKRREILEDPHIGAFAVIRLAVYLILYLGLASALHGSVENLILFGCSFIVSRSLSGLAVTILPLSKDTGLAHTFQSMSDRKRTSIFLLVWLALASGVMIVSGGCLAGWKGGLKAGLMLVCAGGQWLYLKHVADSRFGGLSGDLNGWFLQKAELWMLGALVLTEGLLR